MILFCWLVDDEGRSDRSVGKKYNRENVESRSSTDHYTEVGDESKWKWGYVPGGKNGDQRRI